jgi:hypothetical protein
MKEKMFLLDLLDEAFDKNPGMVPTFAARSAGLHPNKPPGVRRAIGTTFGS